MEEHAYSPVHKHTDSVVKEFIETYEFLPELWDVKHEHYLNKYKRNAALGVLLEVLKKSNPVATKVDVRKKINTLRSNYRRELKKVCMSRASGGNDDDVYQPTSWTFYALTFLDNVCDNVDVGDNCTIVTSNVKEESVVISSEAEESIVKQPNVLVEEVIAAAPTPAAKRRKLMDEQIMRNNDLLERVDQHLANSEELIQATVWAQKLRHLEPTQRIFAEKAINDILFEATIGNLTNSCEKDDDEDASSL